MPAVHSLLAPRVQVSGRQGSPVIPIHILRPLERFRDGLNVVVQDGADAASVQVVWAQDGLATQGVMVVASQRQGGVDIQQVDYAEVLR